MERGADPLHQALAEIAAIRGQMARAGEFRGYGPATLAATGLLAVAAGFVQPLWVARPLAAPGQYVAFWCAAAAVAAALIAAEALARSRRLHGGLADAMIRAALEQFLPAALAGILLTAALMRWAPDAVRLLPGLWQVIFSLGVFATCRFCRARCSRWAAGISSPAWAPSRSRRAILSIPGSWPRPSPSARRWRPPYFGAGVKANE